MYKCLKEDFAKLSKKINRIINKLKKHNINYKFEIIGESIEEINIIDNSNPLHVKTIKNVPVEVVTYDFSMDDLKLGNYEVVAILEHNKINNSDENLVYLVDPNTELDHKFNDIPGLCEHCNTKRRRNKTVLLRNNDDSTQSLKQIGLTCLKDYTGIEGQDLIRYYMDIRDIIIEDVYIDYNNYTSYLKYMKTIDYLAHSIKLTKEKGYIKDETKIDAWNKAISDNKVDNVYIHEAEMVIDYFANKSFPNNTFLTNTKLLLQNEYNEMSGFIAYAYMAYKKQIEVDSRQLDINKQNSISKHIGKFKDRITIEIVLDNKFTFDSYYGSDYGVSHMYLFKDKEGNVYKWNTAVSLVHLDGKSVEIDDELLLKGTIKGHGEYKGCKQTELTRCKVVEK